MSIGTKKLVHIVFVVRDLDKVVDAWTKILGIERPRIWNIPGPDLAGLVEVLGYERAAKRIERTLA